MIEIDVNNIPNQEVSVALDNTVYTIELKQGANNMFYSIKNEEKQLVSGFPLMPNMPLLTRKDKQITGNFYLLSTTNEYPYYLDFGETCTLVYESNQ